MEDEAIKCSKKDKIQDIESEVDTVSGEIKNCRQL